MEAAAELDTIQNFEEVNASHDLKWMSFFVFSKDFWIPPYSSSQHKPIVSPKFSDHKISSCYSQAHCNNCKITMSISTSKKLDAFNKPTSKECHNSSNGGQGDLLPAVNGALSVRHNEGSDGCPASTYQRKEGSVNEN